MGELEILQQRFSDMAQRFSGLMHVLSVWPKGRKEPKLQRYIPTQDNLLAIWGSGLVGSYAPGKNMKHWLIRPDCVSWSKDEASGNLLDLAEKAGQVLHQRGFLRHFELSKCIKLLSERELIGSQMTQFWVLVVHELGSVKRFVYNWRDIKTSLLADHGIESNGNEHIQAYYEIQADFFLESVLLIPKLLEMEEGEGGGEPGDLITLVVAENRYNVTRLTLLRAIKKGELHSYRPANCAKNSAHIVSESDVARRWPARRN